MRSNLLIDECGERPAAIALLRSLGSLMLCGEVVVCVQVLGSCVPISQEIINGCIARNVELLKAEQLRKVHELAGARTWL